MRQETYRQWMVKAACSDTGKPYSASVYLEAAPVTPQSPKRRLRFVRVVLRDSCVEAEMAGILWARDWVDTHDNEH